MLGQGTYGHVTVSENGRCVKTLAPEWRPDPQCVRMIANEYYWLSELNHPNIVPVLGYDSKCPSFEMPMLGPDVGKLIVHGGGSLLSLRQLRNLQGAVVELFKHSLTHLDIKPENLLVDGKEFVFIDLGLSETKGTLVDPESVVTPGYRAPEHMGDKLRACTSLDVFALGVVALEMVVRRRLYAEFKACAGSVICMQLLRDRLLREVADADMRSAIAAMLQIDVQQRHMSLVTRGRSTAEVGFASD